MQSELCWGFIFSTVLSVSCLGRCKMVCANILLIKSCKLQWYPENQVFFGRRKPFFLLHGRMGFLGSAFSPASIYISL